MDCLDLSPVFKRLSITNMQFVFGHIHILYPESERLPDADCRFIKEPYQETVALVATGIQKLLHLILRNGLWVLPFCFFLLENIFFNRRSLGDMVEERFIPSGASWKESGRRVFDVGHSRFQTPMVIVKAPHHGERMINGPVRTRLGNGMGRKHLERPRGQFEPEHKMREIIECYLLPVEMLLGEVFPIVFERVRIRAKGLTS